jgi:hypothetical protein
MNLQFFLPSLKATCVSVHTHHTLGTLSKNAAVAVAFDKNDGAHVLFVESDTKEVWCPTYIVFCAVVFGSGGLTTFMQVIKGLKLNQEQEVERMTSSILSLLAGRIYELQPADERLMALAGILNCYAVQGILAGIASVTTVTKQPESAGCSNPQRN